MDALSVILLICLCVIAVALTTYIVVTIIKNHWLGEIMDTVKDAIRKAEELYPEGHGEEKLKIVLDAVEAKCKNLNIPYNLLVNVLKKIIATIIADYNIIKKG